MITTFDIENILYQALSTDADLTSAISGSVYKGKRPINSMLEDVVVGSLPVDNEDVQRAVANVNIHVPNLSLNFNGLQDNTQPDNVRLNLITKLVIAVVDDQYHDDHWFYVQQQNTFGEEKEHYSNIRINFYQQNFN